MNDLRKQNICDMLGVADWVKRDKIQSLWSGYGEIAKYELVGHCENPSDSGQLFQDDIHEDGGCGGGRGGRGGGGGGGCGGGRISKVVIKHVKLPDVVNHPRGWATDHSHQRKVKSYEVELAWYANWAHRCTQACRVPRYLGHALDGQEMWLVLEDLDASGYGVRKTHVDVNELDACVSWLAHFHAQFLYQQPKGLWEKGTYWHLQTRLDEYAALADMPLKSAALRIDQVLSSSPFQTIVHGDAKLANFCFSESGQVAAVDFQYVGGGCGMKDLAYLVGGCLDSQDCERLERHVLETYFKKLKQALSDRKVQVDHELLEENWRSLYPYAWADFQRFLKGWCPDHWKLSGYSDQMTRQVLEACHD